MEEKVIVPEVLSDDVIWKRQFVTSNMDKMGLCHLPYAFTEDGIAHLSNPIPFNIAMYLGLLCRFLKCIEKLISDIRRVV